VIGLLPDVVTNMPVFDLMLYDVTADPPLLAGALNEIVA
jgi:hypothetical protein